MEKHYKLYMTHEGTQGELTIGVALYSNDFHASGSEKITTENSLYPFVMCINRNPPLWTAILHETVFREISEAFSDMAEPTWDNLVGSAKLDLSEADSSNKQISRPFA